MTALPSEERLKCLRDFVERHKEYANQNVGGPMAFATGDTIALLDCALTVRRLETWLRGAEWRFVQASEVVGEGEMTVTLGDICVESGGADRHLAHEAENTLLAALRAALEKAGAK